MILNKKEIGVSPIAVRLRAAQRVCLSLTAMGIPHLNLIIKRKYYSKKET